LTLTGGSYIPPLTRQHHRARLATALDDIPARP